MRITAQAKQDTHEAIVACATRLFAARGLEATSTREIAKAAKIAVGTLFNYFPTKEALAISIVADALAIARETAPSPVPSRSLNEDLFTLIARDIRALEPLRPLVGEVLDAGLASFGAAEAPGDAGATIRAQRLADAASVLELHGRAESATPSLMHLYWSLYLGVLSYWTADPSPNQEDTWALLDQSVRMFAGALAPSLNPTTSTAPSGEPSAAREGA